MVFGPIRKILLEVVAVPKNSLYYDPAVANAGWTASKFDEVALSWKSFESSKHEYEQFLSQLQMGTDKFSSLVTGLALYEFTSWLLNFPALLLVVIAAIMASPCLAITLTRLSRRLVWCAWLVTFLPPFLVALVFPMRSLLPWAQVLQEVCVASIQTTFNMPGSTLASAMTILNEEGVIGDDVLMSQEVGELQAWCSAQGDSWHASFYDVTLQCIWDVDSECRAQICESVPSDQLMECLGDCLTFALERQAAQETIRLYRGTYDKCMRGGGPKKEPAIAPGTKKSNSTVEQSFEQQKELQQMLIVQTSKAATVLALQSEYVVGTLVGTVLGRTLLTSSLGLLGGVSKALANVKAMFPCAQAPGWILILTTSEAVPIYAGLLGVFNQTVGDSPLAIACTLAAFYVGLGTFTGWRMNQRKSGHDEREKFYRLIWYEYAMRVLVGVGIVVCLAIWIKGNEQLGLQNYIQSVVLTPTMLVALIFQFYSKKIMTTIASMDAVLSAFVQSELWQTTNLTGEARSAHLAALNDLSRLCKKPSRVTPSIEIS